MASEIRQLAETLDGNAFLAQYPEFDLRPRSEGGFKAVGTIERLFKAEGLPDLPGRFELVVEFPLSYPDDPPVAYETGGVIKIDPDLHRNKDRYGSFCLETPLKVKMSIRRSPAIVDVLQNLVFPFLYRFLHQERFGESPPDWGEIDHYDEGRRKAYRRLLRVSNDRQLRKLLQLLSLPESVAGRKVCFCGKGRPVASCHIEKVDRLRLDLGLPSTDYERELRDIDWFRGKRKRGGRRG